VNYLDAFDQFDAHEIIKYDDHRIAKLLTNVGIVRNKLKINAVITNAHLYLAVQEAFGTFDKYIWQFVNHRPIINQWDDISQIPATTPESDLMSKDLKKRGFKFVGSTICYAYMQAVGMVNDHTIDCFRWEACNPQGL
jgi:DNA-3-methyladenine glycosylase I